MTIRAAISSDTIATSCGIEVHVGSPVLSLCRRLVAEGCDPAARLQAYRGDTLCLTIRSIGEAAGLRVVEGCFQRVKEPDPAPPMSLNAPEEAFPLRKPNNDSTLTVASSLAA